MNSWSNRLDIFVFRFARFCTLGRCFFTKYFLFFCHFWKISEQKWHDFVFCFSQKHKNLQKLRSEFWCLTRLDRRSRFIFCFHFCFRTSPRALLKSFTGLACPEKKRCRHASGTRFPRAKNIRNARTVSGNKMHLFSTCVGRALIPFSTLLPNTSPTRQS